METIDYIIFGFITLLAIPSLVIGKNGQRWKGG